MRLRVLPALLILITSCAAAESASDPAAQEGIPATSGLSIRDAVVLGVVEGVTEFLPISSTGHLIIANRALGLDSDAPLRDPLGGIVWYRPPSEQNPDGEPLTLKLAADTYIIVIQLGAIAAIVLVFWPRIAAIWRGLTGRDTAGLRLLRNMLLAFFPVVIVGLLLDDWIEARLFSVGTVVAALVSGAFLMMGAERWRRAHAGTGTSLKDSSDLTPREALQIGLMQCLALWPGMSRSMVTMVGGYFAGLSPARAAEFSFLVGLPVLGGAAVYKGFRSGSAMIAVFGWPEMVLGAVVAAISAAAAVRFLIAYLARYGLGIFAAYRLVLALVLTIWFIL